MIAERRTRVVPFQVKSQSIIKLYIFYNMLEVGDKLMSSFGQDSLDALHWTATEPRRRKRQHLGTLPHFFLATVYVCILAERRGGSAGRTGVGVKPVYPVASRMGAYVCSCASVS